MPEKQELAVFGGVKAVTLRPPHWPHISDDEIEELRQTILRSRTDWTEACCAVGGGIAEKLEHRFAGWLGREHAVATCGGGAALHIACMAAGVRLGDEVITTPYSWGQTVSCILQAGGVPRFGDIDPERLTLDPATVEPLVNDRTRAIVVAHIYGIPADIEGIVAVARRHGLTVIEDCAQAQGSRERGRLVGTQGDLACFSIGSGKNIAAGDGGLLLCDDRGLYERALMAGMHPGRTSKEVQDPELRRKIDSLIYTYRINTFTAAVAYRQMDRLEQLNGWRRKNAARLRETLDAVPGLRPQALPDGVDPAWHMVPWTFVADEVPGVTREQYIRALAAEGVPISGSYVGTPIHLRRAFQNKEWWLGGGYPWAANPQDADIVYREGDCPVAERRCSELDLRIGGGSWYEDVSPMIEQIADAFRKVTAAVEWLKEVPTGE
jgi:dTDP-4-amino-4,6-dideoxygalactose transaminase